MVEVPVMKKLTDEDMSGNAEENNLIKRAVSPEDYPLSGKMPLSRDSLERSVEAIAMSCARGPVQAATLAELIENGGKLTLGTKEIPKFDYLTKKQMVIRTYGTRGIEYSSWRGLAKRLQYAGFTIRYEKESRVTESKIENGIEVATGVKNVMTHIAVYWDPGI